MTRYDSRYDYRPMLVNSKSWDQKHIGLKQVIFIYVIANIQNTSCGDIRIPNKTYAKYLEGTIQSSSPQLFSKIAMKV